MKNKKIIFGIVLAVVLVAGVVASNVLRRNAIVKNLKVVMTYGAYTVVPKDNAAMAEGVDLSRTVDTLLTASHLRQQVLRLDPTLLSIKVKDVDRKHLSKLAEQNPYVESAKASTDVWGNVVLKGVQHTPVVHIFTSKNEYYLSHDGKKMPLSREGEASVLVGTTEQKNLQSLLDMAVFLYDNPLYGSLFDQVGLNKEGDILLVPKVGEHIVVVGGMEDIDSKMADLLVFYRKGLPQVGWNTYKQISLKYKGQIICQAR